MKKRIGNPIRKKAGLSNGVKVSVLALGLSLIAIFAHGLDYPHTNYPSTLTTIINCGDCHFTHGTPPWDTPPSNIDETYYNNLCWTCHQGVIATTEKTHSSLQLDNSYGDWSMQCWECHDPHNHEQPDAYGIDSYLYSGTSDEITNLNEITKTNAGWTTDQFAGMMVIPDTTDDYYVYQIISNTADTLTVKGPMDKVLELGTQYNFAIFYGRLVRSTINAPDMDTCEVIANEFVCSSTISKTVRFFREQGANSFADGDATYDGVCEGCHTQPTYHRNDATGNHAHNVSVTLTDKCTSCHTHLNGFRVPDSKCNTCHGYPPIVDTTGGPDGLADNPGTTGSETAGAHDQHVNRTFKGTSAGYGCGTCHKDSVGSNNPTHNNGDLKITLGFSLFGGAYLGGIYDGQTTVTSGYDSSEGNTTVVDPATGVKTCSNLYCHSIVQSAGGGALTPDTTDYATPVWDTPSSVVCGSCHKADGTGDGTYMNSGSHTKHVQSYTCDTCHNGTGSGSPLHVNNIIEISFTSLNSSGIYSQSPSVPGDGLGYCSSLFCHDAGATTPEPTWGVPLTGGCADCHGFPPTTNAHAKHVQNSALLTQEYGNTEVASDATNYAFGCGNCHPTDSSLHSNGTVEITLNKNHGGTLKSKNNVADDTSGYSQTPGTSVTCSASYCHSDAKVTFATTPDWYGGTFTGDVCANCHLNSPSTNAHGSHVVGIHYDNIYTGSTGLATAGDLDTSSHGNALYSTTINCNICHNDTLTISRNDNNTVCNTCHSDEGNAIQSSDLTKTVHVSGAPDVAFNAIQVKSKAQIRDDITGVPELNTNWDRTVSGVAYKAAGAYDEAKNALDTATMYNSGTKTCSTIACHNGYSVTWDNPSTSCNTCHTELP